jgi:hypothetical protein
MLPLPLSIKTATFPRSTACYFILDKEQQLAFIHIVSWEVFATLLEAYLLAPGLQDERSVPRV